MRIITGSLKGRRLKSPTTDETRPTSDRTKEGMFNVIDARRYFDDLDVLDLFGGSGNLGFEAISRGAAHVTFVDSSRASIKIIEENAEHLGVTNQIRVICSQVDSFLSRFARPFDLVFADPPYDYPEMSKLIDVVLTGGWLAEGGWFLLEHDKRHHFTEHPNCVFSKPYGRTIVSIFVLLSDKDEQVSNDVSTNEVE
jgi:16S rRNA (guanine(966)-N(2))-methyltransferase RsmD